MHYSTTHDIDHEKVISNKIAVLRLFMNSKTVLQLNNKEVKIFL